MQYLAYVRASAYRMVFRALSEGSQVYRHRHGSWPTTVQDVVSLTPAEQRIREEIRQGLRCQFDPRGEDLDIHLAMGGTSLGSTTVRALTDITQINRLEQELRH